MEINLAASPSITIVNRDESRTEITFLDLEFYIEEARVLVGGSFMDLLGPNSDQMDDAQRNIKYQKYRVDLISKLSGILTRVYQNKSLTPGVCDKILDEKDSYQEALKKSLESTPVSPESTESTLGD